MKHAWLSAKKFIFHVSTATLDPRPKALVLTLLQVPVPLIFPELREVYKTKVKRPMDLTTIECTLLAGNRYASPQDFVDDVCLVFANAIRFNKDGRDLGDPLSCAYYDASVHLLKYSRWLATELLSEYFEGSEHVDEGSDGLPPFNWRFSKGNRQKARLEMENLVLNEVIDKSFEGDRYTWHESECEKLLKALRHQSDLKYMTFFIQANYPPDYAAFISKPMDWEKVQRGLRKRQYDKFGEVIDDLRLIFTNALKYNAPLKGTDSISGRAYASAEYMSVKLEAAVNKMLVSVSDRLERERIDHNNAEREFEAAERAEEEAIRAAWKKEGGEGPPPTMRSTEDTSSTSVAVQKIRLRRAQRREAAQDLEVPYFDEEDNGQHERSYFELIKYQKSMFERQRQDAIQMRKTATDIGLTLFDKLLERQNASAAVKKAEPEKVDAMEIETTAEAGGASSVLSQLEDTERKAFKFEVKKLKLSKPKALPLLSLE